MAINKKGVIYDAIMDITDRAIMRLARKAGIKRLRGSVYAEIRIILKRYLEDVIRSAVVFVEHRKAKRISGADIRKAHQHLGHPMVETDFKKVMRGELAHSPGRYKRPVRESLGAVYSSCGAKPYTGPRKKSPERKPVRFRPGTQSLRQIKFYQKQAGCFSIAVAAFQRLIREVVRDFKDDVQMSEEALHVLQLSAESYLIHLLEHANLQSLHAGRVSVFPEDIQLARRLRSEN